MQTLEWNTDHQYKCDVRIINSYIQDSTNPCNIDLSVFDDESEWFPANSSALSPAQTSAQDVGVCIATGIPVVIVHGRQSRDRGLQRRYFR